MSNVANCNYFPKRKDNGCCDEGRGPFVFHEIYLGFNYDIFDDVYLKGRKDPDPCCTPMKSCREDPPPKCQQCSTCSTGTYRSQQQMNGNGYNSTGTTGGQQQCGGYLANRNGGSGNGNYSGSYGEQPGPYAPVTGSFVGGLPERSGAGLSPCACNNNSNDCQGGRRAGKGICCATKKAFNPKEIYVGFNETVYKDYGTSDCRCC